MDSQERFENMVGLVEAHQYEWAIWQAAERTVQLSTSQLNELYNAARNADSLRSFMRVADDILAANNAEWMAKCEELRKDAERWNMNIQLMRRKHSQQAINEVISVVDKALAKKEGA